MKKTKNNKSNSVSAAEALGFSENRPDEKNSTDSKPKKPAKKKSGKTTTILLAVIFVAGLALLLYPTVSNYYNSFHQTKAIGSYTQAVAELTEEDYDRLWDEAVDYNRRLFEGGHSLTLTPGEREEYNKILDVSGNGIMAYIEIPKIKVSLPIYHGTDEAILQVAVGHIEGTSLPVGGESTHCVLSGHRGLPSARLFTDLDQLIVGDEFVIRTLDEILTYEIDQILIVLPNETEELNIAEGKDYCTLVTCTPYGINTHRMLVRGHRVDNRRSAGKIRITADLVQIDPYIVAPIVSIPLLLIALIVLFADSSRRRKIQKIINDTRSEIKKSGEPENKDDNNLPDNSDNENKKKKKRKKKEK